MAITNVSVVSVPVSDPERAKQFYVKQLGFEVKREDKSIPGLHWVQVAPKGSETSLTLVTWFESMPPGSLQGLVFASDDIQSDYEALNAVGVEFQSPPKKQPWGTEAVFRDPDGNRFVLQKT
jgi:predicted enzyme related to lactoylglutathione lyase